MAKLRIIVIFALTVIIVVTLYAEQKHNQAVTAADAAIQAIEGASLGGVIERMIQSDDKPLTALASIAAALPESCTPAQPSQKNRLDCDRDHDLFLDELLGANKTPSFPLGLGNSEEQPAKFM
jgi:hypothetical protein